MRFSSSVATGIALLLLPTETVVARSFVPRQEGTVDPGIAANCASFEIATEASKTCDYFVQNWGISKEDFIRWNPSVKADCSGIVAGHKYCVDVQTVIQTTEPPPPPVTATPGTPTPVPSGGGTITPSAAPIQTPTNVQPGIVSGCNAFYLVTKGQSCESIVHKFGNFTLADFLKWNAGVGGEDCKSLWADTYACIGIVGGASATIKTLPPTTTSIPAVTGCQVAHPKDAQPGSLCECKSWYLPGTGEFCYEIKQKFHLSDDQFNAWNPLVGKGCENLWKGYYVCVGA